MPTLLSDPPFALYATLVVSAIVCGSMWLNRRDRKTQIAFVISLLLLAGLFLLDRLFESPREESVRRVLAMTKAASARDTDAFLGHIADKFEYQGEAGQPSTVTRDELRNSAVWHVLKQNDVYVAAWDFDRNEVVEIDDNNIEIGFLAKAESGDKQIPMYFRAKFSRQADGQMKLSGLSSYDAMKRTKERQSIPYFP